MTRRRKTRFQSFFFSPVCYVDCLVLRDICFPLSFFLPLQKTDPCSLSSIYSKSRKLQQAQPLKVMKCATAQAMVTSWSFQWSLAWTEGKRILLRPAETTHSDGDAPFRAAQWQKACASPCKAHCRRPIWNKTAMNLKVLYIYYIYIIYSCIYIIYNCSRYINFLKDVASPLHQHSSGTIPSSSCSQLLCSIRGIAINHDHAGSLAREVSGACEMPPPLFSIPINMRYCYCFEICLYQLLLASSKWWNVSNIVTAHLGSQKNLSK